MNKEGITFTSVARAFSSAVGKIQLPTGLIKHLKKYSYFFKDLRTHLFLDVFQ